MKLAQLCEALNDAGLPARFERDDRIISGVNTLDDAVSGELSFLSNPKYHRALQTCRAAAVIARDEIEIPQHMAALRCDDPYAAVTVAITVLHGHRKHPQWGVSERAVIDPSAKIGENANIAGGVTIAADVTIGNDCTLYPGCYLGDGVRMGDGCTLYPNVVVYDRCTLGDRVTIHAGSVIGEDGLGYAPRGEEWVKIPQIGTTQIGDDVEIGANCTIDRATLGRTEIGPGTKFGNVVVIGHGTKIGPNCMFVGQVGIAGSVTVGRHVTLAGQVGVAGHLTIGDGARVGAQSGITGNVDAQAELLGSPAIAIQTAKRSMVAFQKLPGWIRRIKDLEREMKELRARIKSEGEGGSRSQ